MARGGPSDDRFEKEIHKQLRLDQEFASPNKNMSNPADLWAAAGIIMSLP